MQHKSQKQKEMRKQPALTRMKRRKCSPHFHDEMRSQAPTSSGYILWEDFTSIKKEDHLDLSGHKPPGWVGKLRSLCKQYPHPVLLQQAPYSNWTIISLHSIYSWRVSNVTLGSGKIEVIKTEKYPALRSLYASTSKQIVNPIPNKLCPWPCFIFILDTYHSLI